MKIYFRKSTFTLKRRQNQIYNAPYKGSYDSNGPKFGDIILMARGTLEKGENDSYTFVQADPDCDRRCLDKSQQWDNVTALWTVERIRHRDPDRGHRYELKFTVAPLNEDKSNGADTGYRISKSYIIRDEDYPKYFEGPRRTTQPQKLTVTRRSDRFATRRTLFDMFDFTPFMNALSPFSNKYLKPDLNLGEVPPPRLTNGRLGPTNGMMAFVRVPVQLQPNTVRFPDQRTPFSGQPMNGLQIFLNNQKPNPPIVKPVYDLDKVYDYNKLMDYRGAIDAKKVFPDLNKETTEVTDNSLDWKPTTDQQKAQSASNGGGGFQYTTVYDGSNTPKVTQPISQALTQSHTQSPPINQVTTGLIYPFHQPLPHPHNIPFNIPHYPLTPFSPHFFPFAHHPSLAHIPQTPFSSPLMSHNHAVTQSNAITNSGSPTTNNLPTTTHYGTHAFIQGDLPPFTPLHHALAKIRPLSRIPMTPPRKEINVQVFKESPKEPQKYSSPDPFFSATNPPSTSTYKNVLPSPYSTHLESTTGATVFDKPSHDTHRPVHLADDTEFVPIKHTTAHKSTFEPTRIYSHSSTTSKPDSINAQLPAPDKNFNTKIPYIDAKTTTKKAKFYGTSGPTSVGASYERVKPFKSSTLMYTTSTGASVLQYPTSKYRSSYKTTEKPVLKWIPKKQRRPVLDAIPTASSTSTTSTTTRIPNTTRAPLTSTTQVPFKFEPTTIRPRFIPTTVASHNSTSTEVRSTVNVATSPSSRYRGRGRFSLKRRGDNRTYFGSLEDGVSQESGTKQSVATSISSSVELSNRRKLKRTRVSRFNVTATSTTTEKSIPILYVTTTPSTSLFLQTTSVEPLASTTPEIYKADVRPVDTKLDDLHLFKATDIQDDIPSNVNELDNLAVSILEHARSLHSPRNNYHYNSRNSNNHDSIGSSSDNKEKEILPLEKFFRP